MYCCIERLIVSWTEQFVMLYRDLIFDILADMPNTIYFHKMASFYSKKKFYLCLILELKYFKEFSWCTPM